MATDREGREVNHAERHGAVLREIAEMCVVAEQLRLDTTLTEMLADSLDYARQNALDDAGLQHARDAFLAALPTAGKRPS
jgi:hypothetical protein